MSPFDPQKPPEKVLVTLGGVQIIVQAAPPPSPPRPPPPPPPLFPDAIHIPANQSAKDLDAIFTSLCEQHRDFMVQVLRWRGDVLEESAKDLAQNVLVSLWKYVRTHEAPTNVRGFLFDLIDKEVIDHKRRMGRRPQLDREADPHATPDSAPNPEEALDAVQHMAKVQRCIAGLPHREAEVVRYIALLEKTIAEAAKAFNRPQSTVAAQCHRGVAKLNALANEPEDAEPPNTRAAARRRG